MYRCVNCGAEIERFSPKCPSCGYINEEGAEKHYMEELEDVRKKLDRVDEEAEEGYYKNYIKVVRVILITIAVMTIVSAGIYILARFERKSIYGSDDNVLEEIAWQREHFAYYNSLYDAGEYDRLAEEFYSEDAEGHDIYEWEHYDFISLYYEYISIKNMFKEVDGYGYTKFRTQSITYDCLHFCLEYNREDEKDALSQDEHDALKPAADYVMEMIHDRLGFSDEELDVILKDALNEYGNLSYDKCGEISERYIDQFR